MTYSASLVAVVVAGLLGSAMAGNDHLVVNSFAPYPTYTPGLNVGGGGTVTTNPAGTVRNKAEQVLNLDLWGVDTACLNGADPAVTNGMSCGIEIGFGVTCAAA